MNEVREYLDEQDQSPFARWFDGLNAEAAAKVAVAVTRMEHGNLSNVKGGTKKRQSKDIEMAKSRWQDYQRRKKAQPRETE